MNTIEVKAGQTLNEVSETFHALFPFLQIHFFSEKHTENQASSLHNKLPLDVVLEGKSFSYDENTTVEVLESNFQNHFNLSCQVLRLSGNVWLQTTTTDHWTLAKQNEEGRPYASEESKSDYSLEDNN